MLLIIAKNKLKRRTAEEGNPGIQIPLSPLKCVK